MTQHRLISRHFDVPRMAELAVARQHGAYVTLPKLARATPEELTALVMDAGLRGRGGAGFPTGRKWASVPKDAKEVVLIVNADESEPGTFKDRAILERDPHLMLEGMLIAIRAVRATRVIVYIRGEYAGPQAVLEAAIAEAAAAGLLPCEVVIHRGAGAYICGEETALIESVEGKRGMPRLRPPYPPQQGLFGAPTVVQNVETLANLPAILREGAVAYRRIGTPESPGTKLVSVSGAVAKPGVYEVPMGRPLLAFIAEEAGGVSDGRGLKAVLPGGVSAAALTASEVATAAIDFESLRAAGSDLGSGGMIVIPDSACMVRVLADIARFFAHESCGQCTPCREGTGWVRRIAERIEGGQGRPGDVEQLLALAPMLKSRAICGLADALAAPLHSIVTKFRKEFGAHVRDGGCSA